MSKIDLHIHSDCSDDGELTPVEIMEAVLSQGMELISITDHNSVRGVKAALEAAGGITVISGIELDCTYSGKGFHLLGYGFDHTRHEFMEVEQDILKQEQEAAEEKIYLFSKQTGIPLAPYEVLPFAKGGVVTGELIGEILLSRQDAEKYEVLKPYLKGGAKSDMPNVRFYWDFFSEGKAAYVALRYLLLEEAVKLIHSAGGKAVLAHPGQNLGGDDTMLKGILASGIDGIEVFSSYHGNDAASHYLDAALDSRLFVTCGSDFHGKHKPLIELGGHGAFWEDVQIMRQLTFLL